MASLGQSFNHEEVAPDAGGGVMPKGDYELEITESDVKEANSKKGLVMSFTAEVVSGEFKGRKVWERINISHENPVAQKIGQGQLSALCKAAGVDSTIEDSEQLHFKPFWAHLDIESYTGSDGKDKLKNVIKKYHFDDGAVAPTTKAAPTPAAAPAAPRASAPSRPAPAAAPAAAGARSMPWKKSA